MEVGESCDVWCLMTQSCRWINQFKDWNTWNTFPGSENSNDNKWTIIGKSWMKQNMQSWMEQNFNSAQYSYIHSDHPTNESQGKLKGFFLHASQGGCLDQVHSDQMVLKIVKEGGWAMWAVAKSNSRRGHDAQVHADQMVLVMARHGGWTAVRQWPRTLKSKLNLKGDYQTRVHPGQMALVVVRQGGWTMLIVAKDAQGRVGKWL